MLDTFVLASDAATVSQSVVNGQMEDIDRKIASLHKIRESLEASLLDLRQEELELDDERTRGRMLALQTSS